MFRNRKINVEVDQLNQVLDAISKSQAMIEFSLDGKIINANYNFLSALQYTLEEVKDKHHRIFCDPKYANSHAYINFWHTLSRGEFLSGEFKRIAKDGSPVWISASYNPILDQNGKPYKVVKFATDITQQKLISAEHESKINAIDKSQAVIEFTLDGIILKANDNFLGALKYEATEVEGKHHRIFCEREFINSQEYTDFWDDLAKGQFKSGEYKRIAKDGSNVWINATYNPIFDAEGHPYKVVKYATEVTEQKLKSAEHESKINAINKSQAVIEFTLDGTIIDANPNFLGALKYELFEVQGKHHRIFCERNHTQSQEYRDFWANLAKGEFETGEFKRIAKDGSEVWINANYNPIFDAEGKPYKVVKYATDITEQVEIRETAKILSLVANETDNSVIITDEFGLVEFINPGFTNLTGYTFDDIQGKKPGDLLQGPLTNKDTIARISTKIKEEEPFYEEVLNYSKSGTPYWISISINPIHNKLGKLTNFISVQANITETKQKGLEYRTRIKAIEQSNLVIEWDANGNFLKGNQKLMDLFEFEENSLLAHSNMLHFNKLLEMDSLEKIQNGKNVFQIIELELNGHKKSISSNINPINNFEGKLDKIVLYGTDISTRREAIQKTNTLMADVLNKIELVSDNITKIAKRTNTLSLNAGIESARVGKAGEGFGIIAEQIRNLSTQSSSAAVNISETVKSTKEKIQQLNKISN